MTRSCDITRAAITKGQVDPSVRAHAKTCDECAQRLSLAAVLPAALLPAADAASPSDEGPAPEWSSLQDELDAHQGLRARLWSLGRGARFALVALAGAAVTLGQLLNQRADLSQYPADRMVIVLLSLTAVALPAWWLALRPLHRAGLRPWQRHYLVSSLVLLPVLMALLPQVHTGHAASVGGTGDTLLPRALACFVYGAVFAVPVLAVSLLADRGRAQTFTPPLVAAGGAAVVANLLLQLHCPLTHPMHLLTGHASLSVALVLAFALWWWWRARARWHARP